MGIRGIAIAHLRDRRCKNARTVENIRILSKEAENQPRHKVIQILPAIGLIPVRVILQQFNIEAVEARRSLISKAFSRICRTVVIPASAKKNPKWS